MWASPRSYFDGAQHERPHTVEGTHKGHLYGRGDGMGGDWTPNPAASLDSRLLGNDGKSGMQGLAEVRCGESGLARGKWLTSWGCRKAAPRDGRSYGESRLCCMDICFEYVLHSTKGLSKQPGLDSSFAFGREWLPEDRRSFSDGKSHKYQFRGG